MGFNSAFKGLSMFGRWGGPIGLLSGVLNLLNWEELAASRPDRFIPVKAPDTSSSRRSQLPRRLRHRSTVARLLRSWVRIPPAAWMSVCCECFVLSGRGLCDELITRPEESYRLWCVVVCDLETSWMRSPWPTGGLSRPKTNKQTSSLRGWVDSTAGLNGLQKAMLVIESLIPRSSNP